MFKKINSSNFWTWYSVPPYATRCVTQVCCTQSPCQYRAECQRIEAFELWCWWRLLGVPWTEGKSNQSILKEISPEFIGRTDAEAETPILKPSDAKNWLTGKDPDAGQDWRQEKGTTKNEMVGWHHWLDGHEFEQVPGVGDRQGSLACCCPQGCKESDMTEQLDWLNTLRP